MMFSEVAAMYAGGVVLLVPAIVSSYFNQNSQHQMVMAVTTMKLNHRIGCPSSPHAGQTFGVQLHVNPQQ
jgi:hypothetical protein